MSPRHPAGPTTVIIVMGHLLVDPAQRDAYLETCVEVVTAARAADGCLDYTISADLVDPARIQVVERWETQDAVEAFRGAGTPSEQQDLIREASVAEYDVGGSRSLTG